MRDPREDPFVLAFPEGLTAASLSCIFQTGYGVFGAICERKTNPRHGKKRPVSLNGLLSIQLF